MDVNLKKQLGQNFLTNQNVASTMVNALDTTDNEQIIEIGAGMGFITKQLVTQNATKRITIDIYEIDQRFIPTLEKIKTTTNIKYTVHNEDFLKTLLKETNNTTTTKIIGAIPYYITSPIIHKLLNTRVKPNTIVLLIQKEVAQKITAGIPKANYWSSLTCMYSSEIIKIVPRDYFNPKPNVDSAILRLHLQDPEFPIPMPQWSRFLHMAYKNPRKMLNKTFPKEALLLAQIDPSLRAQNIDPKTWLRLYDIISSGHKA